MFFFNFNSFNFTKKRLGSRLGSLVHLASLLLTVAHFLVLLISLVQCKVIHDMWQPIMIEQRQNKTLQPGGFPKTRACLPPCRAGELCPKRGASCQILHCELFLTTRIVGSSASGAAALHPRRVRPTTSAKGASERGGVLKSTPSACNQTSHPPPWQGSQGGGGGGGDGEDGGHAGTELSAKRHPRTQPCPILPCTRLQGGWWK